MMKEQYHILNGDALKDQFPKDVKGEIIVARECLVDGNVAGNSLEEIFETRASFISKHYDGNTIESYYQNSVSEFDKMRAIPSGTEVNLWFEDDLFCQVNFWFVGYLLHQQQKNNPVYLVRPKVHSPYGFAALNSNELSALIQDRKRITDLDKVSGLWIAYQLQNFNTLLDIAIELEQEYPFIFPAVKAHIDRFPTNGKQGRPEETLFALMTEFGTDDFGQVFKAFNEKESIYGFGDLQVKRLFDIIKKNKF